MPSEISGKGNSFWHEVRFWLVVAMLGTILFSWLNLNSYCIIGVLILTLIDGRWKANLYNGFTHPLFLSFLLIFLLECAGLLHNHNLKEGLKNVETSAGLIALPFLVITGGHFFSSRYNQIMRMYCLLLLLATVYCVSHALYNFAKSGNPELFFYHQLLSPLQHHAVYFSVFLLIGIVFLFTNNSAKERSANRKSHIYQSILIAWFFFFIVLLASKLMILAGIALMTILWVSKFRGINKTIALTGISVVTAVMVILLLSIDNPVSKRFFDMFSGNAALFRQEKFSTDIYFNGLQFRLLNWRFGFEILNENNAFLMGVSPGDAQQLLNEKFIATSMYTGDPQRNDTGLLNYNFHNQFLQTLVETGLTGLIALLINCIFLLRLAFSKKNTTAICTILLLIFFFLTESVLERQYGIFLYAFFPLFMMAERFRK